MKSIVCFYNNQSKANSLKELLRCIGEFNLIWIECHQNFNTLKEYIDFFDTHSDFTIILSDKDIICHDHGYKIDPYCDRYDRTLLKFLSDLCWTPVNIISPTDSGSSFLKQALSKSTEICSYYQPESTKQHFFNNLIFDFPGLSARNRLGTEFTKYLDELRDDNVNPLDLCTHYIRELALRSNSESFVNSFKKKYILDKNPMHLVLTDKLVELNPKTKFILLVRDPFAIASGANRILQHVFRKLKEENIDYTEEYRWERVGRHVLKMVELLYNIKDIDNSILVRYEDFTDNPDNEAQRINTFLNISDVNLTFIDNYVKQKEYGTKVTNLNSLAISKIPEEGIAVLKKVFSERKEIFNYFGYSV